MKNILKLLALIGICWTNSVIAGVSSPSTSTGYYTVSWSDVSCFYACQLLESKDGGAAAAVHVGTGYSKDFSAKPPGTYVYTINYCFYMYGTICFPYIGYPNGPWSTQTVVGGSPPVPESLAEQTEYQYEMRSGDFDPNGYDDLLVRRLTPSSGADGSMQTVILSQDANGFTTRIPTAAEVTSIVGGYPINSNILHEPADTNYDGHADILLKGMSVLNHLLTDDYVLYAPGTPGIAGPLGLTAMDSDFMSFFADFQSSLLSPTFFAENTSVSSVPIYGISIFCYVNRGAQVFYDLCIPRPKIVGVIPHIGIGYNPEALNVKNSIDGIILNDDHSGGARWWDLAVAMERVLGVYPFGFKPDGSRGPTNIDNHGEDELEWVQILEQFIYLIEPVLADAVDPEDWPRHHYDEERILCQSGTPYCTVANAMCWLQKTPAPMGTDNLKTVPLRVKVDVLGGMPIQVHATSSNTLVNETLTGHILHDPLQTKGCGSFDPIPDRCSIVENKIEFDGTALKVKTHGAGYNKPGLNYWMNTMGGNILFGQNNLRLFYLMRSQCTPD